MIKVNTSLWNENLLQNKTKGIKPFPVTTKDWKNTSPDYGTHVKDTNTITWSIILIVHAKTSLTCIELKKSFLHSGMTGK